MSRALRCRAAPLDECHAAHVILIDGHRSHSVSLGREPVTEVKGGARGVGQSYELGLGTGLGAVRCLGREFLVGTRADA
jgi:hypothetical protein